MENLLSRTMRKTRDQTDYDLTRLRGCPLVGFCFASSGCPPSVNFSELLQRFYDDVNMDGTHFEVVLVPHESDEGNFRRFAAQFGWATFALGDPKIKELYQKFKVCFVPHLVVVDAAGEVVSATARREVTCEGEKAFERWMARLPSRE